MRKITREEFLLERDFMDNSYKIETTCIKIVGIDSIIQTITDEHEIIIKVEWKEKYSDLENEEYCEFKVEALTNPLILSKEEWIGLNHLEKTSKELIESKDFICCLKEKITEDYINITNPNVYTDIYTRSENNSTSSQLKGR